MYSRKVQKKYIADTRLQERNQEKHMVVWLKVVTATWLRYQSMSLGSYIVEKYKRELNPAPIRGRMGEKEDGGLKHVLYV